MNSSKASIVAIFSFLLCFNCSAQTIKQLNGIFTITTAKSVNGLYEMVGDFSDPGNIFSAANVLVADQIVDKYGNAFNIETITSVSGSSLSVIATALNGAAPGLGKGILFRPTNKGYPLLAQGTPEAVLNTVVNTSAVAITSDLPKFESGTALPVNPFKPGDVVQNSSDQNFYQLASSGWQQLVVTPSSSFATNISSVTVGAAGSVIFLRRLSIYYYSDGTAWSEIPIVSTLSSTAKYGDVFYQSSEKKLYMMTEDTEWLPISSSSIPGGGGGDLPSSPKPGDLFFNTDENKLLVYDTNNTWVEVSVNGSTPGGVLNPDPATSTLKEGSLFYNTTEKQLYVYNGSTWMPVGNALASGQIYVGNTSNVAAAVSMSGDATITTSGKLTVKVKAISDEKLDKENIPLSGFAAPTDNVSLGDGTTNYKIINLANPSAAQDAVTKSYVDVLFQNPANLLSLPLGNFFVGNASGKAVATLKSAVPLSGFGNPVTNISMNGKSLTNLASPSNDADAANKAYVDGKKVWPINIGLDRGMLLMGNELGQAGAVEKFSIPLSDWGAATKDIAIGNFKIMNLADPVAAQDAATKNYVDTRVFQPSNLSLLSGNLFVGGSTGIAVSTLKKDISLSGFGPATADISLGNYRILNLANPVGDNEAVTKKYVDDLLLSPVSSLSLPAGNMFVGNSYGKAAPTLKTAIPISGFGKATETLYMGDASKQYTISYLAEPVSSQDAATKSYVDSKVSNPASMNLSDGYILVGSTANVASEIAKGDVSLSDFGTVTQNLSLGNYKIVNLADPDNDGDAVNKKYLTTQLSAVSGALNLPLGQLFVGNASGKATATAKTSIPLSGFGVPESDLAFGSHKITALADPLAEQDAATKKYVDSKSGTNPSGPNPPSNPSTGSTYYNTTDKTLYVYDGSQWVPVSNSSSDLAKDQFLVGNSSNKAEATDKANIPLSGFGAPIKEVSMGSKRILDVATPILPTDAANKTYVDVLVSTVGGGYMSKTVYDTDGNNKADDADKVNGLAVETAVPANAVFTDEKVKVGATGTAKVLSESDFDGTGTAVTIKSLSVSKLAPVTANSIIGNNTSADAIPTSLSAAEVKTMLALNNVDNTRDINKDVSSATRLTNPVKINGISFDGTADVSVPGDDLGNHTASQNIKTAAYSISSDGQNGRGLSFESAGNAVFGQDVTVKGNLYTPSDRRLKTGVETLGDVLKAIDQLRGVRFEYIDQKKYASGPKIGVIAQELRDVYPEMVTTGSDGFLKVDYTQLTAVLIQAVKEQQEKLQDQQLEIEQLKARVDRQQQQINVILQKMRNKIHR